MVDSIKITALQDIGANIAYTTLVPVVNMAGTPTTQKANLQNLGNLILNGAGGSYFARAAQANLALSVVNAAQPNITSVGTLSTLAVTGNITAGNINGGNIVVANFYYGDGGFLTNVVANGSYSNSNVAAYLPTFTGTVGANRITSNTLSGSNVEINANGAVFMFGQGGALQWPAPPGNLWVIEPNSDSEFEIRSTSNVVISTDISNINARFTFDSDGIFTAPSNVNLLGSRLNVGPDAIDVTALSSPTLIIANSAAEFIQAAIININSNGSADWVAQGADSDDEQGFSDFGFTGHSFNDPNFTITEPGDGYVFSQGYANGIGGSLVLATGENGNTTDIVFATGGFLANNEFARIDHANDVFHLTRANSGIQFYDGTIQTTAGGGGVSSELVNGSNSLVLDGDGNIVLEGTPSGNAVNRGLVWDFGANSNGVNSTVRQDNGGLSVRAWTENGGGANGYSAPVNIVTNQDAATKTWEFDGQGNLTVPTGSINSINDGGDLGAYITLTPDLGLARLAGRNTQSNVNYTNTSWSTATYTGTQIDFTNAPDLVTFFNENQFNVGVNQTFSINGDEPVPFTGYTIGVSNAVTVYTDITAEPDPTTVTSIDFYYQLESYIAIDYDSSELNINATGLTINIDNDQTEGPDIVLRSGDDITLQAKDMSLGSEREGGDINLNAGDGADDDGAGNTASTGGDIILDAGRGGDGNSSSGSSGGFTTIRGGAGGSAGVTNAAGPGGYVSIVGGDGGTDGGNTSLGGVGGNVSITAGLTRQEGVNGPNVTITSGQAGPNALAGYVDIVTPASANGLGGTWRFDGNGNLTLPNNTFAVNYANGTQVPLGAAALGNVTFDDNIVIGTGDEYGGDGLFLATGPDGAANLQYLRLRGGDFPTHIHLDTGNNAFYDQYFGNDNKFVKLEAGDTGNVVIGTDDATGNLYNWTFTSDGNFILANGNSVIQSIANSSLDPLNPNISTMVLTPDPGYGSQALVLDPTFPGHIHLRSPGANIDEPYSNIFLGGETSSFEVGYHNGAAPNLFIHSGNNTWTFDNAGNLAFPRDAAGNSDPYLNIFGGSTPTIQSTDVSLAGPANLAIQADYLNYSGFNGNRIVLHADTGEIATDANMTLTTNLANTGNTSSWTFSDDGLLTLPGGNVTIGNVLGGEAILASNTPFGVVSQGNGSTVLQWIDDVSNASALSAIYINSPSGNTGDVAVLTGEPGANANIWTFGADGILTVPGNLVAVSASPAPVISGFSSVSALQFTNGNSNVTVNANSNLWNFDSTGNLIIPGSSGGFIKTVSNASIGIAAVDNGTNNPAQLLSLNAGTGAATSIVSAYATNVAIQTNAAGAINTWAFDSAGNLTLPGNTVAINFANGSAAFGNIVAWTTAPVANTSAGTAGQAAYDSGGNLYVCVAANTWSKFAGTTSW